jgi:hypothetical protein
VSPFAGGVLTLVYAIVVLWSALDDPRQFLPALGAQIPAAALVTAALAWCLANGIIDGAGGAIAVGLSSHASANTAATRSSRACRRRPPSPPRRRPRARADSAWS